MQNENIHRLLSAARNVNRVDAANWTCLCPVHEADGETHTNSCSVSAGDDGKILVNCFNGCDPKQIIYAFGLTWGDCFPPKQQAGSKITATYDYIDADGVLRFQVCRIEPGKDGRAKDFRQRQPDDNGGWTWKTKGLQKFIYRLRELAAADPNKPVFVVEGEKQVDYLRSLGLIATCNPGGAGRWLKSYAKYLDGRNVIIVPDCDPPNPTTGKIVGAEHARDVADSLIGVAKSIHVVELPGCEPKWGLDDWLQKGGHTLQELREILRATPEWGPESTIVTAAPQAESSPESMDPLEQSRKILEECGIVYVAQHDDGGSIEIFSECTQKFSRIQSTRIGAVKYEDLVLAGGARICQMIRRNDGDAGKYSLSEVRIAIASIAAQTSASEEKHGIGVWENSGCVVVVNSRQIGVLNGGSKLEISSNPIHYGVAYDTGDRVRWIDLEAVRADITSVNAAPGLLHHRDIELLISMFAQWEYRNKDGDFPSILAGMVLATFVQTLWQWRPQVFLTGQAYAGKTTLFRMLETIFGPLCETSANSSAAGIRQYLGRSGRIALCDELEKSKHRTEIIEMVRASGRGDNSFRGSSGNQKHVSFKLQHIFWCASIESGLTTEADQSRFLVVELNPNHRKPNLPSVEELSQLGQRLAAAAICSVRAARKITEVLLGNRPESVHGRVCESYAVPVSMLAACLGWTEERAIEFYHEALTNIASQEEVESDSESLLQEIMLSPVMLKGGEKTSVQQMILNRYTVSANGTDYEEQLKHLGVYLVGHEEILINRNLVVRGVLGHDWKGRRVDTLLGRLKGAKRVAKKIVGTTLRFVSIPYTLVSEIPNSDEKFPPASKTDRQDSIFGDDF